MGEQRGEDQGRSYGLHLLVPIGFVSLGLLPLPQVREGVQASLGRWSYILILSFLISLCLTRLSKPSSFSFTALSS